ncbi:hypothetical protein Tco_0513856 [Tanacetum coccineum]
MLSCKRSYVELVTWNSIFTAMLALNVYMELEVLVSGALFNLYLKQSASIPLEYRDLLGAFRSQEELEPGSCEWSVKAEARTTVENKNVKKDPGFSWIDVKQSAYGELMKLQDLYLSLLLRGFNFLITPLQLPL